MKDQENLKMHNVKDGMTIHLVVKAPTTTAATNAPSGTPRTTSAGTGWYKLIKL